ncbi:hypothetical protein [Piscinibacter sakaiensis]|uniref:EF-hand domain-containing protein n=1 Tax=Piscinibacter sakaiensis TaxID=1547922 RepID=A0A0K8P4G3_PISS1|nr:hypothetical protein [Piscinibacter sakaiensis]GAP37439.1 hypothetical protein ISF6_3294 [Piscinibacter sakaiensis]
MAHAWTFFRAGGVDQVVLRSGADLAHLHELDQKLWVALACPTQGLEIDARTLTLIDADHDGRLRAPEVVAATRWACARLRDPDDLVRGGDRLRLASLVDDAEGAALQALAREVLVARGRPDDDAVTLADLDPRAGLLPPGAAALTAAALRESDDDAALADLVAAIAARSAAQPPRTGADAPPSAPAGAAPATDPEHAPIDRAAADAFFAEAAAVRAWRAEADGASARVPLGERTVDALAAWQAVRAKVDDYFTRARIGGYDARAVAAMNPSLDDYAALAAAGPLSADAPALAALPLAPVAPGRPLPLVEGVNPAWAAALATLREQVVGPLLAAPGAPAPRELREDDWQRLGVRLDEARRWLAARPEGVLAGWDGARLAPFDEPALRERLAARLDEAELVGRRHALIDDLEKLVRLQRDLLTLLRNMVSFAAFYRREGAIFQAGTLYLDGRSCELSVRVADPARHALVAGLAKACLVYCECRRAGRTMHVVSAVTAGDTDFLFAGRNGVFYDRQGLDWDATVTKVIENPTSILQAFWSPYKKFLRMVEEQVAKRAAASEGVQSAGMSALAGRVAAVGKAPAAGGAAAPTALRSRIDVGTVAALGVALGSLSAVLVGVFGTFVELGWWIPLALGGIVLAISGPSMLIAWLKLRQRSLGPLLDASGWAINGRMRVDVRLGGSLSQRAVLPQHARRLLAEPGAPRRRWGWALVPAGVALALGLAAWRWGLPDAAAPELPQAAPVVAPAASVASAAAPRASP